MNTTPIELIHLQNHGRTQFLINALAESGLDKQPKGSVVYEDLKGYVIGGDERGSDYKYGYFGFYVRLLSNEEKFECRQKMLVGNYRDDLTDQVNCVKK